MTTLVPSAPYDPDALAAELEEAIAAGTLDLDPEDYQAFDLDPATLTIDDFALETAIQTRIQAPVRPRLLHPSLIVHENARILAREIGPLADPGASTHAVISGNFIFGDFIEAWVKECNFMIPDLYVATLSLSEQNIFSLYTLLEGEYVQRLHLTVSDYWYSHERGALGQLIYEVLDPDGLGDRFQLSVTNSHAKICLLAPVSDDTIAPLGHYIIHGSANLRSSASIEQFAIEHDRTLYDFHRAWLDALEAQYRTIHHEQPGRVAPKRQQWHQVLKSTKRATPAAAPPPAAPPSNASATAPKAGAGSPSNNAAAAATSDA